MSSLLLDLFFKLLYQLVWYNPSPFLQICASSVGLLLHSRRSYIPLADYAFIANEKSGSRNKLPKMRKSGWRTWLWPEIWGMDQELPPLHIWIQWTSTWSQRLSEGGPISVMSLGDYAGWCLWSDKILLEGALAWVWYYVGAVWFFCYL